MAGGLFAFAWPLFSWLIAWVCYNLTMKSVQAGLACAHYKDKEAGRCEHTEDQPP